MKVSKELRDAAQRNFDALSESKTFCCLFSDKMVEEVLPLLQMGLAVYLDKPIIVVAPRGSLLPHNLRAMATAIAEFDPDDLASMKTAVQHLVDSGKM